MAAELGRKVSRRRGFIYEASMICMPSRGELEIPGILSTSESPRYRGLNVRYRLFIRFGAQATVKIFIDLRATDPRDARDSILLLGESVVETLALSRVVYATLTT